MAFPIGPIVGQQYVTASGTTYEWDGQGWVIVTGGGGSGSVTGTPLTFAGYDSLGDLFTIPNWTFDGTNYGATVYLNVDAVFNGGANYRNLHTLGMTVNPTANSDDNWSLMNKNVNIDPSASGFNINGYVSADNTFISYNQPNTVQQIVMANASANIGDGINAVTVGTLYSTVTGWNIQNTSITNFGGDSEYANITDGDVDSWTLLSKSVNFTNVSETNNGLATNFNLQFDSTASTGTTSIFNSSINLNNSSSLQNLTLYNSFVTIDGTSSVNNLTLGQLGGSGAVTQLNGFQVDVSGFISPNRKQSGGFNGGSFFVNGDFTTTNSVPFDQAHLIGGNLIIEAGSPITGTAFIFNNLASNIVLNDDMDSGILDLGFTPVGFVGQFTGTTGNTVDRINMATAGMAIAAGSTGGNVTDWVGYHSIGVANFGGVIDSVTNVMGFSTKNSTFGTVGTNVWGVYIPQSNADNWFNKSVTIGGSTGQTVDSFVGLDIAEPKTIQAGSFTTAERTAITTAAGGNLVYDEDLEAFYFTDNSGAWQAFGGGVANNLFTADLTLAADRLHDLDTFKFAFDTNSSDVVTINQTVGGVIVTNPAFTIRNAAGTVKTEVTSQSLVVGSTTNQGFEMDVTAGTANLEFNATDRFNVDVQQGTLEFYNSLSGTIDINSGGMEINNTITGVNLDIGRTQEGIGITDALSNSINLTLGRATVSKAYNYPAWQATTAYLANDIVYYDDGLGTVSLIKRIASGTSGATFDATEAADWDFIGVPYFENTLDFTALPPVIKLGANRINVDSSQFGLAANSTTIYVGHTSTSITTFDKNWVQLSDFDTSGAGVVNIEGLAVNDEGSVIYINDSAAQTVYLVDGTGASIGIGSFSTAGEMTASFDMVFDSVNNYVWVMDSLTFIAYAYDAATGVYTTNSINFSGTVDGRPLCLIDGYFTVAGAQQFQTPVGEYVIALTDNTGVLVTAYRSSVVASYPPSIADIYGFAFTGDKLLGLDLGNGVVSEWDYIPQGQIDITVQPTVPFTVGETIYINGTTSNDNSYVITAVTGTVLTLNKPVVTESGTARIYRQFNLSNII